MLEMLLRTVLGLMNSCRAMSPFGERFAKLGGPLGHRGEPDAGPGTGPDPRAVVCDGHPELAVPVTELHPAVRCARMARGIRHRLGGDAVGGDLDGGRKRGQRGGQTRTLSGTARRR